MRDQRYIAVHRGGLLEPERHRLLAAWAAGCAERLLSVFEAARPEDSRPRQAIATARAWASGGCSVGEARAASVACLAAARETEDPAAVCVARACGHAVATAHMADHAPGAAMYALRAIRAGRGLARGKSDEVVAAELAWQKASLPAPIRELVLSTFATKFAKEGMGE